MSYGTGLSGFSGFASEAGTYGTYQAPDRFLRLQQNGLKRNKNTKQATDVRAGHSVAMASRRAVVTKDASGPVKGTLSSKGWGLILANIMGSATTPVQQASTAAYLQTHAIGNPAGLSFSCQVGVPDAGGTVHPFAYTGCKIQTADFECPRDDFLTVSLDVDAQDVSTSQTLATPSYLTDHPFHGAQMSVSLGTLGSEAVVSGITSVKVTVARKQATGRFYAGATPKSQPIDTDLVTITGELDVDFLNLSDFQARMESDGSFSLIITWTGIVIASTYYETFSIALPCVVVPDDGWPTIDGTDIVSGKVAFTALSDETHAPMTITYMSSDAAL